MSCFVPTTLLLTNIISNVSSGTVTNTKHNAAPLRGILDYKNAQSFHLKVLGFSIASFYLFADYAVGMIEARREHSIVNGPMLGRVVWLFNPENLRDIYYLELS